MNEADTCRKLVLPLLQSAGWDDEPHSVAEQRTITDGRIVSILEKEQRIVEIVGRIQTLLARETKSGE